MSAKGLRVFIFEDEAMIRMMEVDMLEELGHSIAAEAGHLDKAIELARSTDFDLAILDVNLDGKNITPVAELIKARGLPLIFATGYGAAGVPEEFRGTVRLCKSRLKSKRYRARSMRFWVDHRCASGSASRMASFKVVRSCRCSGDNCITTSWK
jgi:CheY-like chemotaxis protein